jgi:organic hydroperoxide reductase OsmC/OhrA
MLTFLAIASRKGHIVDLYEDDAIGYLEKNEAGRLVMTRVILRPRVMFSGDSHPSAAQVEAMHDQSHRECFIANSVKTDVSCRPILGPEATSMGSYDT